MDFVVVVVGEMVGKAADPTLGLLHPISRHGDIDTDRDCHTEIYSLSCLFIKLTKIFERKKYIGV